MKSFANPDVKVFMIGNKNDLEDKRQVKKEEAEQLKSDLGINFYIETSAKSGFNSQNVFIEATKCLYENYLLYTKSRTSSISSSKLKQPKNEIQIGKEIDNNGHENKKGCC